MGEEWRMRNGGITRVNECDGSDKDKYNRKCDACTVPWRKYIEYMNASSEN